MGSYNWEAQVLAPGTTGSRNYEWPNSQSAFCQGITLIPTAVELLAVFLSCLVASSPTAHSFSLHVLVDGSHDHSDSYLPVLCPERRNPFSFSPRWTKSWGRTWNHLARVRSLKAGPVAMVRKTWFSWLTGSACSARPSLGGPTLNGAGTSTGERGVSEEKQIIVHIHSEYEILYVEEFIPRY